jgi:hypothetical protein
MVTTSVATIEVSNERWDQHEALAHYLQVHLQAEETE